MAAGKQEHAVAEVALGPALPGMSSLLLRAWVAGVVRGGRGSPRFPRRAPSKARAITRSIKYLEKVLSIQYRTSTYYIDHCSLYRTFHYRINYHYSTLIRNHRTANLLQTLFLRVPQYMRHGVWGRRAGI